jgi:hypothetical protein
MLISEYQQRLGWLFLKASCLKEEKVNEKGIFCISACCSLVCYRDFHAAKYCRGSL